jgi:predicted nucleic acid-binding protein
MASLRKLDGKRIYFDANVYIYIVEGYSAFEATLKELLYAMDEGRITAVTSELTLAETLVKPILLSQPALVTAYERSVANGPGREAIPVTREVLREAAAIRAASAMRLPDAIHLATALHAKCNLFLTNDTSIASHPSIDVLQLSSLHAS